jgi:hypothetical protein
MLLHGHVDSDGALRLNLPPAFANADVDVAVSAASKKRAHDAEAWRKEVLATAGSIPDRSFRRYEQGEYEEREAF